LMVSVEERSQITHPVFEVSGLTWQRATKTKNIRAIHIQVLMAASAPLAKLALEAIEGYQTLKATGVVCEGVDGDFWQQQPDKLLQKYDVVGFDEDGWMICQPKPENEVECYLTRLEGEPFSIIGLWGERHTVGGQVVELQFGEPGDAICRNLKDPKDVWIVARRLFDSTYEVK